MAENYQIDSVDIGILEHLKADARMPYTTIARKLGVSSGTIHARVNKLTEARIITGSRIVIDYKSLGYDVTTILGIHLKNAGDHHKVMDKLNAMPEVTEVY